MWGGGNLTSHKETRNLMPLYDYKCECEKEFECFQQFHDKKLKQCLCEKKGNVKRLISKPTIISDDVGRRTKRMTDKELYKELDIE